MSGNVLQGSQSSIASVSLPREYEYLNEGRNFVYARLTPPQNDLGLIDEPLATKINEVKKHSRQEVKKAIRKAAERYQVPAEELLAVANCESGFDQSRIGAENEIGIFQYHPRYKTFEEFAQLSEMTYLNVNSAYDQIELTAWAFLDDDCEFDCRRCHWTCYRLLHPNHQCKDWH